MSRRVHANVAGRYLVFTSHFGISAQSRNVKQNGHDGLSARITRWSHVLVAIHRRRRRSAAPYPARRSSRATSPGNSASCCNGHALPTQHQPREPRERSHQSRCNSRMLRFALMADQTPDKQPSCSCSLLYHHTF